jgi:hypothetical protein
MSPRSLILSRFKPEKPQFDELKVVSSVVEGVEVLQSGNVFVTVFRGYERLAIFRCPCGCGAVIKLNLDARLGKAWRLIRQGNVVSLRPSVWLDSGCESHFIVWRSRVWFASRLRDLYRPKDGNR